MHERALLADLVHEIESVASRERARRVVGVRVRVGPMSHMTPAHFVEHFVEATRGTVAEGARCDVDAIDPRDPLAQSIVLESVELED
ncbi:MAG TPA: hydrogenase/urease maturation nickel metallochaperone HypA [Gaiellaceae bacterium]|jgi:hydrogenase nickel incorporation protein HypA/HybF|nr:hydrogenase/urease maturation nickel metallochaperone HypA [Gaiellaceae bacterium]